MLPRYAQSAAAIGLSIILGPVISALGNSLVNQLKKHTMKLALLITLFSATYSWGLEYSEIIGDYKCDLTEVPHGLKNEASNSMELKNLFGEVIFRFKKDGKLDLLNLINKDQVEGTYDISAIDLAGDDLTLSCKSILADVRSVNYLVQITKFSKHYLFKINNISLLFVRDDDSEMQKEKSKIKQLDDSGYLRDGKSMVWWGTGPCGLENDKGSHEGVLVGCLYDHSPAAISGLQLGDEII